MWQTDQGVNAMRIDREKRMMRWYRVVGCGCDMEEFAILQTLAEFEAKGPPTMLERPPHDVLQEIDETLALL